jgi:hypothetical protein
MNINRRSFMALASGLLVPTKAYSFAGGWALPAYFIEYSGGAICELVESGFTVDPDGSAKALYFLRGGLPLPYQNADPIKRVRIAQGEACYEVGEDGRNRVVYLRNDSPCTRAWITTRPGAWAPVSALRLRGWSRFPRGL